MRDDSWCDGVCLEPGKLRAAHGAGGSRLPRLQQQLVATTLETLVRAVLDLGVGSGLTADLALQAHPNVTLVGIDANADMLAAATASLEGRRSRL